MEKKHFKRIFKTAIFAWKFRICCHYSRTDVKMRQYVYTYCVNIYICVHMYVCMYKKYIFVSFVNRVYRKIGARVKHFPYIHHNIWQLNIHVNIIYSYHIYTGRYTGYRVYHRCCSNSNNIRLTTSLRFYLFNAFVRIYYTQRPKIIKKKSISYYIIMFYIHKYFPKLLERFVLHHVCSSV